MIVRRQRLVRLDRSRASELVSVDASCVNMHRGTPSGDDLLILRNVSLPGDLAKLLSAPEFLRQPYRVQQFAIWTITDDPARKGYTGIGSFGFGSGPSDEELGHIKALFEEAGIDPGDYRAFSARDRPGRPGSTVPLRRPQTRARPRSTS